MRGFRLCQRSEYCTRLANPVRLCATGLALVFSITKDRDRCLKLVPNKLLISLPMPCRMVLPWTSLRSYSSKHGSSVVLRPYQESCLEACTDALKSGASRIGVSLPTGSGKTTVFITLLSRILPSKTRPDASKSLIIVNSIELARQSATQALRLCPTWSVEIEQGVKHQATGKADVYVTLHPELPCN